MPGCGAATLQSPITRSVSRVGRGHERTLQRYGVRVMGNARGDSRGRAQLKVLRAVRQRSTRCRRWWSRAGGVAVPLGRKRSDPEPKKTYSCDVQYIVLSKACRPMDPALHNPSNTMHLCVCALKSCSCSPHTPVVPPHDSFDPQQLRRDLIAYHRRRLRYKMARTQSSRPAPKTTGTRVLCFAPRRWRPPLPLLTGALGSQEPRQYCFVTTGMRGVGPANVPPSYAV